ncbi:hypothetical protein K470DRAFT_245115 [Piedraia hortae CBS 480.64]|uniref:Reverse transcriptase Ty1/copia-type domain-containing protein n=1 Tax=Piedraia hortae CBS 480.64 TaxID=1314780 RepID=A0A6A7C3L5_9PEZI|nr:hypothetical protein K470DRAFT_245115 [Piedraia hortae CBS 480.64]
MPTHRSNLSEPQEHWHDLKKHPQSVHFREAAQKEYDALCNRENFEVLKAKLCARGDLQPVTKDDAYSATLVAKVFRVLMSITAACGLETAQLNAANAFVNAPMTETVYVRNPPAFHKTC